MKALVVGAGKSGVAAANFLARRGDAVTLTDSSDSPLLPYEVDERVEQQFGVQEPALLEGVDEIVLSPGVPATIPLLREAAARGIRTVGEIELAFRYLQGSVIAVTGSNGKSTTTALIGEIFRVAGRQPIVAGNIGDPLIGVLDLEKARTYVLELSSFQLESVDRFRANVALLLNVTPDHMDRYPNFDAYAAAKYRIFRNQQAGDVAIVNAQERRNEPRDGGVRVWRFSAAQRVEEGAWLDGDDLVVCLEGQERRIPRGSLKLQGASNVENALAAWLAARAAGVSDLEVQIAFGTFAGLPHRMAFVRETGGVRWVNDSKGTNVDATMKSLEGFDPKSVILILGGKDKAGEFERMRELVSSRVRTLLTIGSAAGRIAAALEGTTAIIGAQTMDAAVTWSRDNARSGETVLLSPACASFDQYRNFEDRGEHFESLVKALDGAFGSRLSALGPATPESGPDSREPRADSREPKT